MGSPLTCLAGVRAPAAVVVEAVVVSADAITSPLTGERAAFVQIDLVEHDRTTGSIVLGDTLVLEASDGTITLVPRRARIVFFDRWTPAVPLTTTPPEIVPLLRGSTGSGALAYREHVLANGCRVRLRAFVEASGSATFVARDDLGPVIVEEIVSG